MNKQGEGMGDALTRQRTEGALVRIITPVYGNRRCEGGRSTNRGIHEAGSTGAGWVFTEMKINRVSYRFRSATGIGES